MPQAMKTLACLFVAFAPLACSKETKPVAEDARAPAPAEGETKPAAAEPPRTEPSEGEVPKPAEALAAKDTVSDASFDLKIQPSGSYQVGQSATVEIVLDAKQPFKVNKEYPYSFALQQSEGVSFPAMKVQKDSIELKEEQAVMKVNFTPQAAGERTIAGTFKFSVCTEEQCLIKKEDLALAVNVK